MQVSHLAQKFRHTIYIRILCKEKHRLIRYARYDGIKVVGHMGQMGHM